MIDRKLNRYILYFFLFEKTIDNVYKYWTHYIPSMKRNGLTDKERITLKGLVSYPNLNDKHLAEKFGLKLSTVVSIKRRLNEYGFLRPANVPNFYRLGFELFTVEFGAFNQAISSSLIRKILKKALHKNPNVIYTLADSSHFLFLSVMKNFTDAKRQHEELYIMFNENELLENHLMEQVIFPFEISKFLNFFNYLPFVNYLNNSKTTGKIPNAFGTSKSHLKLSKKEKMILFNIVRFPEESDNRLTKRLKVSKQTLSATKRKFEKTGLVSKIMTLNPEMLDYHLISFGYIKMGPLFPLLDKDDSIPLAMRTSPIILSVLGNFDGIILAPLKDYLEMERLKRPILAYYRSNLPISYNPKIIVFVVEDVLYHKPLTFHELLATKFQM